MVRFGNSVIIGSASLLSGVVNPNRYANPFRFGDNMQDVKKCTKCGEVKPFKEFGFDKRVKSGLTSQCRMCRNAQVRECKKGNYSKDWPKDIAGVKYGKLTAIRYSHIKNGKHFWICNCECGNVKALMKTQLVSGKRKSCGCYREERRLSPNGIRFKKLYPANNCEICGTNYDLNRHHKDRNRENNKPDNIQILCRKCHGKHHGREWWMGYEKKKECLWCGNVFEYSRPSQICCSDECSHQIRLKVRNEGLSKILIKKHRRARKFITKAV